MSDRASGQAHYLAPACLDAIGIGALFAVLLRVQETLTISPRRLALFCLSVGFPRAVVVGVMMRAGASSSTLESVGNPFLVPFYGWVEFTAAKGFPGAIGRVLDWGPVV